MAHIFDLPTEVRMEIFRLLLLTKHTRRAAPYQPATCHALQPAILRVCYQFRQEAGDVLYRENIFVHVTTNYALLEYDLRTAGLCALVRGRLACQFPFYSLRASLKYDLPAPALSTHDFMIPGEDLEVCCSLLWLLKIGHYHQITLRLTVLSPFPDLVPNIAKQESLILPFRNSWHVARAAVDGVVDLAVASQLKKALTGKLPRVPEAVLVFALSLEEQGDQFLQQRNYYESAVTYHKAFAACQQLHHRPGYNLFSGISRPFSKDPSNISCRLMLNIVLSFLRLEAWQDVVESTARFHVFIGPDSRFLRGVSNLFMITYLRRAIAYKKIGKHVDSECDLRCAKYHCKFLQNSKVLEEYIDVEEQKLLGLEVDEEWLETMRANLGSL